jgi:hypothetical protein
MLVYHILTTYESFNPQTSNLLGAGYTSIYAQNIDYETPLQQGLLCYRHLHNLRPPRLA